MSAFALDFETYYDDAYSIVDLGNYWYTHDPRFHAYLVSIAGDGFKWVGEPKDAPWEVLDGQDWLIANAGFDTAVLARLIELGIAPAIKPANVFDVLDLAAYLSVPRNLAGATQHLLKVEHKKTVRDKMKGKHWKSLTPEQQAEVKDYALKDAVYTYQIWADNEAVWPEWERTAARLIRERCARGVPLDSERIDDYIKRLELKLWKSKKIIPWAAEEPVLSAKQLAIECRKNNIPPPISRAKDCEEFEEWLDEYGERFPFAAAMGNYSAINTMLERLYAMKRRTKPDGWMEYSVIYGGTHTMRDASKGAPNLLNQSKEPFYFDKDDRVIRDKKVLAELRSLREKNIVPDYVSDLIDFRGCIKAPPGKKLVPCDESQIEARVTCWLAQDEAMLDAIRSGVEIYEAHARATMGYTDPEPLKKKNPLMRHQAKTRVLSLGFRCGFFKLLTTARRDLPADTYEEIFGGAVTEEDRADFMRVLGKRRDAQAVTIRAKLPKITPEQLIHWVNAFKMVSEYRSTNPKINALWVTMESAMKNSINEDFRVMLPSGRAMLYRNVRNNEQASAEIIKQGKLIRLGFHGGVLTENAAQALARDIFVDRVNALDAAGFTTILCVYDEAVQIVDESTAEEDMKKIESIMATAPEWMSDIPLGAEGSVVERYTK